MYSWRAPTRSSAELKQLLGEDFEGILSSDCFSAYNPQSAAAKQKCLTHLERDLEALKPSRFEGNRLFAQAVGEILTTARTLYRDYHAGKLSRQEIAQQRPVIEAHRILIFHVAMLFTIKLLRKVNYTQGDVRSLLQIEFDENYDLLCQTILEITELTNSYLQTASSASINTVAKRSEFTKFLVENVHI